MSIIPEDMWSPLYKRVNYPQQGLFMPTLYDLFEWGGMYRRACQRMYGDNRQDHIHVNQWGL